MLLKQINRKLYSLLSHFPAGKWLINYRFKLKFGNSGNYWEKRYSEQGTSGPGSYGDKAQYKAQVINRFVAEKNIRSVIELGCGDGNQLQYFHFADYTGVDVSATAIKNCKALFNDDTGKRFYVYTDTGWKQSISQHLPDLALSLDVIFHLVEDKVYEQYMQELFSSSAKFVIIYAWDVEREKVFHVRQRNFTSWITRYCKDWQLQQKISNAGLAGACDFFIYEKQAASPAS